MPHLRAPERTSTCWAPSRPVLFFPLPGVVRGAAPSWQGWPGMDAGMTGLLSLTIRVTSSPHGLASRRAGLLSWKLRAHRKLPGLNNGVALFSPSCSEVTVAPLDGGKTGPDICRSWIKQPWREAAQRPGPDHDRGSWWSNTRRPNTALDLGSEVQSPLTTF